MSCLAKHAALSLLLICCHEASNLERRAGADSDFEKKIAITTAVCKGDRSETKAAIKAAMPLDPKLVSEIAESAFYCGKEDMIFLLPNGKVEYANTLLSVACRGPKYAHRATEAVRKGAHVNQINADGETPFFRSLCNHDVKLLKLAAAKGLDFSRKNNKDLTVFQKAAAEGDLVAIKALVSAGAPVPKDAVVVKRSERRVPEERTETVYLPGNRTVKRTTKGERTITDTVEIPLLEYAKSNDPELYQLLMRKTQAP